MRKWIGFFFIFTVLAWAQSLPICADIYIWTDENGVKHFANEPPSGDTEVKQEAEKEMEAGLQEKLDNARSRRQDEITGKVPVGSDERVTRNPGKVVIFTMSKHPESISVRNFFKKYKIAYTDCIINEDKEAKRRFEMLGSTCVPLVFVGDRRFYGFNYELLNRLFGIRE